MTQLKAQKILKIGAPSLKEAIKNKKIKLDFKGKIEDESVYEYLKELDERKAIPSPKWINMGY